ncbi:MAG: lysophospholipid acyltransferase family protein [Kiritimatiellales bacterium]|nr:lysophospholipid acyltransferase family protein [Kiritimatiellales bacterium]
MKHRPKHIVEYILLRCAGGLIHILPYRAALCLAWLVAAAMHYIGRFRASEARRRIREVFGDRFSNREIRHIAWISWRNLCFNAVESARFPKMRLQDMEKQPMAEQMRHLKSEHERLGTSYIIATVHMGNWEIGHIACHHFGIPAFSFVRSQKNPLTNDYLNRTRNNTGTEVVENDSGVLRSVIRKMKAGKVLAILPDVRARTEALSIDFLGGKANLAAGTALFARQVNCPIYPGFVRRIGWTRHECHFFDPIHPDLSLDKQEDYQRMMQLMMTRFDAEIQKTPEQYFWYNKRWILDPIR